MAAEPKCRYCGEPALEGQEECVKHSNSEETMAWAGRANPARSSRQYQPISAVTIPVVTPQFGRLPEAAPEPPRKPPGPASGGFKAQAVTEPPPRKAGASGPVKAEAVTEPPPRKGGPLKAEAVTEPPRKPGGSAARPAPHSTPARPSSAAIPRTSTPARPSSVALPQVPPRPVPVKIQAAPVQAVPSFDEERTRLEPSSGSRAVARAPELPPEPTTAPARPVMLAEGLDPTTSSVALPLGGNADQRTVVHDRLIGQNIGEFQVAQLIGVGGMGMVYKGVHPLIGKSVAIKVLRPEAAADKEQVQRLLTEARALTSVHHPGIVDVFSFGTLPDGRPYLVMEYLQGRSLQARIESEGRVPVGDALALFDDVLAGLTAAHRVGLVHRDMKPSNIFLARQAEGISAKIVDFGIAKQGRPGSLTPQTVVYRCIGTPEFVSPEQACGKPVGPQSDLYSFGVVAFFTLTGRLPFEGETDSELLMKQVEYPPPNPAEFEPSLPAALVKVLLRLLEKKPSQRPQSAEEVRAELSAIREGLEQEAEATVAVASKDSGPRQHDEEEAGELRSWRRLRAAVGLLVALAGASGALAWWLFKG